MHILSVILGKCYIELQSYATRRCGQVNDRMMKRGNLVDNSESQSASRSFCAENSEKTFKDTLSELNGYACSRILYTKDDLCSSINDADFDSTMVWCIADGIIDNVTYQYAKCGIISDHDRLSRRRSELNFNILL